MTAVEVARGSYLRAELQADVPQQGPEFRLYL